MTTACRGIFRSFNTGGEVEDEEVIAGWSCSLPPEGEATYKTRLRPCCPFHPAEVFHRGVGGASHPYMDATLQEVLWTACVCSPFEAK